MLSKNILLHFKSTMIKFIYILLITALLVCIFGYTQVQATQYTETYRNSSSFDSDTYPGYTTLIETLKSAHPDWTFTILYTGLDWNQVIKNETTASHGRNLVSGSKTGEWVCSSCGANKYDNGSWKCASEATVSYYMDPRNSLFEDYIFQFENLQWMDGVYTEDGINKILADCKYMQGSKITYTKTDGKTATINKSYAKIIMDAAKENKISPYHLAARIRQEQGTGSKASSTASGTYSGYKGYYNFFNIGATGSGSSTIIKNALSYAKDKDWTDPEASINGGAAFIASSYINKGQSTLYLQKFDVDSSDNSLYWHQYMQNVSASKTEGQTVLKTYKSIDPDLDIAFNFLIPVFKNMPVTRCPQPASQSIVTQNIEVTDDEIVVRESKSVDAEEMTTLKKGDKILRIEIGNTKTNGYYWDKVVLSNGKKGYIISSGIKLLDDITTYNNRAIAIEPGNVRNGPGTSGTTVITTLTKSQIVTIVEKGKYNNLNGENWSRIYLSDGRQGYIVERYLKEITNNASEPLPEGQDIVRVLTKIGLAVREHPGTDQKVLKYADIGDYLTRTAKQVSNDNGYIWDEVITDDGIEGYVARGDDDGPYFEVVTATTSTELKSSKVKTSGTKMVCDPTTSVSDIKKLDSSVIIRDASGKEVTSGNIGTGYTIKHDGNTYTVVKKGDVDGDGGMTAADYVKIKNDIMGKDSLGSFAKMGADVDGDGNMTAADYVKIKNSIMGKGTISI